jgi:dGTPase
MDWESLLSCKRVNSKEQPTDRGRTPFQKDYDRTVFVPSFRRLQRKTQVHPLPTNDHIHTRLTHSIEVSCVGRSLGTLVGEMLSKEGRLPKEIDPRDIGDLVQVGCLAHDIGNPPFGHAGEYAVRDWFQSNKKEFLCGIPEKQCNDFLLFEGNAQGFRFLTRLEYRPHEGGLRLTYASLGTFLKYPWTSDCKNAKRLGKFGAFYDDRVTLKTVMAGLHIPKDSGGIIVGIGIRWLISSKPQMTFAMRYLIWKTDEKWAY